jgi:hypothetical protein
MPSRGSGLENGGEALKVGELMKWTQQWVGTRFRTVPENAKKMGWGKHYILFRGHMPTRNPRPCNAVLIYELF